eukprot:scaffold20394_cov109-Isochrysis_galbana.AAC.4
MFLFSGKGENRNQSLGARARVQVRMFYSSYAHIRERYGIEPWQSSSRLMVDTARAYRPPSPRQYKSKQKRQRGASFRRGNAEALPSPRRAPHFPPPATPLACDAYSGQHPPLALPAHKLTAKLILTWADIEVAFQLAQQRGDRIPIGSGPRQRREDRVQGGAAGTGGTDDTQARAAQVQIWQRFQIRRQF